MIELKNVPFPPSNNAIYASGRFNGITRRYLSKKAKEYVKEFRTWAIINRKQLQELSMYLSNCESANIHIMYVTQWNNKNGSLKKKDVLNYDKLMIDQLFSYLSVDDCIIKCASFQKVHSDTEEHVTIELNASV